MAELIRLPKMSDTMEEGVIVKWNVKVGDSVKSGDILADVETDKATMELENFSKGHVLKLVADEGSAIPVDSIIAIIGKEGEDISGIKLDSNPAAAKTEPDAPVEIVQKEEKPVESVKALNHDDSRTKASPLAKKIAAEKGIDIQTIAGSGDHGRIIKRDIENAKPMPVANTSSAGMMESFEEIPVSQMRKTIANRLSESKFTAPHFYLTMEINMDNAIKARERMNEFSEVKISMNDLVVKASAIALTKHPMVNASWLGTKIRINHHIHIGVAMAVDEGLLVPVVRFANQKALSQISAEVKEYSKKAKEKKLQPGDWQGNTFTISNLGMFGIEEFTAIINTPDACILAVGGIKETVGVVNGEIKPVNVMKVTLSCDHRVVDGVVGSKFLLSLKDLLEEPVRLLV
ncbi:MAG: 2-oxo acid dehydrogenase subunit E2 [Flavobacteriales bacterium]|nr:2-oxo acid dehydrogenase subunit E2 [Flavobacteriales bacterium]